ncbi:hypothetical protein [Flavobacterium lacisediminis]|uniref:Trimeric autotransporter adhesin YadA-like head domain-containing protein n=1 Tax=Flavobacterium lacisediminis TaxID=2989705 RepID=A0ABT3EJT1_9FLAO|nr:hypothetical protein [Flavobacterium lacisediminis]MCW1148830.1 hypothetical protein [Flavobacterium lacisediminis]
MKKKILLFSILLFSGITNAQVGIATTNPNPSTILDIVSTDAGIMIPRVALTGTTDAVTISNGNVESLLVYNTQTISDVTPGFYYWYDNKWQRLINSSTNDWSLTGNAGTNESLNFIGTTDDMGLTFRTNNVKTGFISNDGLALHFGINAGLGGSFDRTVFLGDASGSNASGSDINAIGSNAALGAEAYDSNFMGAEAGYSSSFNSSNVFGKQAGYNNFETTDANIFGFQAGYELGEMNDINYFGNQAGYRAWSAENSNFFGRMAGYLASEAYNSNFLGHQSGYNANKASNSIFIGYRSGYNDPVDNTLDDLRGYSILIGRETSTGGFGKSIAIGGGATNTASNQLMVGSSSTPIDTVEFKGSGAVKVSIGTSTDRPVVPEFGQIRYNTDLGRFEGYVNDLNGDGTQGDAGWRAF